MKRIIINDDSQLVISQVSGKFSARDKSMTIYLKLFMEFVLIFEKFELTHIPCCENSYVNALLELASSKDSER